MKILKLSPYYFPEKISSSHLTDDLDRAFANVGFKQENYVPTPSRGVTGEERKEYSKKRKEVLYNGLLTVHRFPMFREGRNTIQRAIRYLLVNIIQFWKGVHAEDIDLVFAASTPPTQGLLCGIVAKKLSRKYKRKVPFVYCLQDVFPDSLVNAKMTKEGSLLWKIGRKIENYTYCNADKIITISEDFKSNIMSKGVQEEQIIVIPNWINTSNVYPVERKNNVIFDRYNLDRDKFYICYSGNIGYSQNMDLLLEVAKDIKDEFPDIVFLLIGEGADQNRVKERIKDDEIDNVIMLPFQDYKDIAHVFSCGDVGLIISKPGIGSSSLPSKTYSIMAASRPILASFDDNSELCKLITKIGCGICSPAGNLENLKDSIIYLYNSDRDSLGERGREYVLNTLNKEKCIEKYISVIKSFSEDK